MKNFTISLILMFVTSFMYGQSAPLEVYNFSSVPLIVQAGATNNCTSLSTTIPTVILPGGGMATFSQPLGPAAEWFGMKAYTANFGIYGKFHSPCVSCFVPADVSVGLSVSWDVSGGCFRARLY